MPKPKLILAYSGGLDTSVICKWLSEKYEVICFAADVGQQEDFSTLEKKALGSGASQFYLADLKTTLITDFIFPAIQFNAKYEGRYLLGTSLARPIIAKEMVAYAKSEGIDTIAHGATGKGNDQIRFELSAYAFNPNIKIVAPWRDKIFTSLIPGRKEAIAYAKQNDIPIKASLEKPWSSDENIMHMSYESGILEDPKQKPPANIFEWTTSPEKAPDKVTQIMVEFEMGIPVRLYLIDDLQEDKAEDKTKESHQAKLIASSPLEIFISLNQLGGDNGIGRLDIVESRFIGMKNRGVYETPAGTILQIAHRDVEILCSDQDLILLKDSLMPQFAELVYNGLWYSQKMDCLLKFLEESQKMVSGKVYLELYKGNVTIIGRESVYSLYDEKLASMEKDESLLAHEDASAFIKILTLSQRHRALRNLPDL